jgi:uncharacterized protein YoxC
MSGWLKLARDKITSVSKRVKDIGNSVSNAVGPAANVAAEYAPIRNALADFSRLVPSMQIPSLGSSPNSVEDTVKNVATSLETYYNNVQDMKPLVNAFFATGEKVAANAVTKFKEYATTLQEIQEADNAETLFNKIGPIFSGSMSRAIEDVSNATEKAGGVQECDGQIARAKLRLLELYMAALSPGSTIVPDNKFAVQNGLPWLISRTKSVNVFYSPNLTAGNPFTVVPTRSGGNLVFSNPTFSTTDPSTKHMSLIACIQQSTMPPKPDGYSWAFDIDCTLTLDAGASDLATQLGGGAGTNYGNIAFFTSPTGSGTWQLQQTCTVEYTGADTVVKIDVGAQVPVSGEMRYDLAVRFYGATPGPTTTLTATLDVGGFNLVGTTIGGLVDRSQITYMPNGNNAEVPIINDLEWLDLMGTLADPNPFLDPNLSVGAIWDQRVSGYNEIFRMFIAYLENHTCASLKYKLPASEKGGGMATIETLAEVTNWLRASGPFGGMDRKRIQRILNWLWGDLQNLINSVDLSPEINAEFSNDNGYCA